MIAPEISMALMAITSPPRSPFLKISGQNLLKLGDRLNHKSCFFRKNKIDRFLQDKVLFTRLKIVFQGVIVRCDNVPI
ncbi:MAG: hypothetical protein FWJ66_07680 [Caldibacillus sp.]